GGGVVGGGGGGECEGKGRRGAAPVRGKARPLNDKFALVMEKPPPADRRIFAFGILANHHEINVTRAAVGERGGNTRHEPNRTQVDILVEFSAKRDQRPPERDVVRYRGGPTDGAEKNGVMAADPGLPVLRHHTPVPFVVVAGREIKPRGLELEAGALGGLLERAHALGNDFLADAVAGNDGDPIGSGHRRPVDAKATNWIYPT